MFCKCGREIHPKRVEILQSKNQRIQCINCAENTVSKVAGFMPSEAKMRGNIIITDQETAEYLHNASWRAGVGVSRGVKFNR